LAASVTHGKEGKRRKKKKKASSLWLHERIKNGKGRARIMFGEKTRPSMKW